MTARDLLHGAGLVLLGFLLSTAVCEFLLWWKGRRERKD